MAAGADTPFAAAVSIHPAMLDPQDGPSITIPYCLLPSMNEDKEAVKAFADAVKVEKYVETFDDMPHVSSLLALSIFRIEMALIRGTGLDGVTVGTFLTWIFQIR